MKAKTLIGIIVGLLVLTVAFILFSTLGQRSRPAAPVEVKQIRIYSGSLAIGLGNKYAEANNLPVRAESVSVATFDMCDLYKKDVAAGKTVDGIWPGSYMAYLYFTGNCPEAKVLDKEVFFRTYTTPITRADLYLPDYVKYGVVYEQDGHFVIRYGIITEAIKRNLTFRDMFKEQAAKLGIDYYPPAADGSWHDLKVNVAYPDPTKSGGGMELAMMNCNYFKNPNGTEICQPNDPNLKELVDQVVANKNNQPQQDPSSPSWFDQLRAYSTTYPLGATSESLYDTWELKLPDDQKIPEGMKIPTDGKWPTGKWPQGAKIVPLYPEWTVATDHPLVCFTADCVKYLKMFREQTALQEQGAAAMGMRTAAVGVGNKPSGADKLQTIVGEWQVQPANQYEVLQTVMNALKQ